MEVIGDVASIADISSFAFMAHSPDKRIYINRRIDIRRVILSPLV